MADEDDGSAFFGNVFHFAQAFFLELGVAYGEDFVDEEDFGFEVGGYCEGETDIHAAGIMFYRGVQEFFHFGEGDDLVEFLFYFDTTHAQDGAVEIDVFATGEFGMEAGADFQEAGDASVHGDLAGGWFGDAAEDFEEGGFAGAIASDDADAVALLDLEIDVFKCPEFFEFGAFAVGTERMSEALIESASPVCHGVAQRLVFESAAGGPVVTDNVFFA